MKSINYVQVQYDVDFCLNLTIIRAIVRRVFRESSVNQIKLYKVIPPSP